MTLSVFLLPPCRGMLSPLRSAELGWTGDAMPAQVGVAVQATPTCDSKNDATRSSRLSWLMGLCAVIVLLRGSAGDV